MSPFDDLDPRVAEYMRKKQEAEAGVDQANMVADVGGVADSLANAAFAKPAVYQNNWQQMGQAPKMQDGAVMKNDFTSLQKQAEMKLQGAKSDASEAAKQAFEQKKADMIRDIQAKKMGQTADLANKRQLFDAGEKEKDRINAREVAGINAAATAGRTDLARQDRMDEKAAKASLAEEALKVEGYGYANNADDAKKLKDGIISKASFDAKLKELIDIRTKKDGGAIWDREAVARAQQLSKDLLLEYKNMQTLGVLSAGDQKIVEAIIPPDPLQYNSPIAAIQDQDPLLNNMKKFKEDSDKDFNKRLQMRLKGGNKPATVKMVNEKGKPYNIPADKAAEAERDGLKRVE